MNPSRQRFKTFKAEAQTSLGVKPAFALTFPNSAGNTVQGRSRAIERERLPEFRLSDGYNAFNTLPSGGKHIATLKLGSLLIMNKAAAKQLPAPRTEAAIVQDHPIIYNALYIMTACEGVLSPKSVINGQFPPSQTVYRSGYEIASN